MKSLQTCLKRGLSALLAGALCLGAGAASFAASESAQEAVTLATMETEKTYTVTADMYKVDKKTTSMADGAIDHTVTLEKDASGDYWAKIEFKGLSIFNQFGYLSKLSYYNAGYTYDSYGDPQGTTTAATVLDYQTDSTGANIVDQYNDKDNPYPKTLKFQLVDGASTGEYVPLQVYVPIMEAISEGSGTQNVLMKLDWSTLAEKTETAENPFTDVASGDWFEAPVLWAVEKEITLGTSATTFSPNDSCTRAQIVTFLWRSAGSPAPTSSENPFTDVTSSDWYYDAVLWAVENGITSGTSATTFSPNDTCLRSQAMTFLWRANSKPTAGTSNPFSDIASGEWYTDAVLWAVAKEITVGTSATTFGPNDTCTRGQIVTFLYRAANNA